MVFEFDSHEVEFNSHLDDYNRSFSSLFQTGLNASEAIKTSPANKHYHNKRDLRNEWMGSREMMKIYLAFNCLPEQFATRNNSQINSDV